jgi:Asp-tRNA(Asn)/Glu-tRNA(Gln) amidotransferase A subunit family amidase
MTGAERAMNSTDVKTDLARLSAVAAREAIATGKLTSEALVRACIARIEERESVVSAWAHFDAQQALAQARAADASRASGLLHGIPVAIKDVIDTADMPTRYGSPIYERHQPAADAACVAMCRAAGAIILGKTITAEFATFTPGKTRNPHNPAHTPGGSSSGSAAAVADFMVPLSVGTQTGGSTIRPASFCGIVGYKPTFGFINRTGVKPVSDALDTVGVFARDVADVALLAAAMSGRTELATIPAGKPPRVALWRSTEWSRADPESVEAVENAAAKLSRAGAVVSEAHAPERFAELAHAHHEIEYFELGRAFLHEYRNHRDGLSPKLQQRIEYGLKCAGSVYDEQMEIAAECRLLLDAVFANFDVILAPSALGEAPVGLQSTGDSLFNKTWTLLHVPCVTVPHHRGRHGLPVGVQLIGRARGDAALLAHAAWVEKALA